MKEGWEYSTIGKLCKTYSGGTPLKNVKEYYQDGNIPWLRSGEVCQKYIYETEMFITQKGLESSSAKYYPINTVVVAMYGATAAQVGILKIEATSNQAVCGIIPNSKFLPDFLYYFFCYRKEFLASQAQGGAQPNISQVKIKNLEVPVPSFSEQQSIVDYLDSAFAKIDAMKANAEKALNEAKALFQASLKEMLEPKEGWEEKRIDEVCTIARGGSPRPIKDFITNSPEGLNWIKIGDTDMGGKYIYSTKEKIKPEGLKKSRWVEVDEFLLSNSMSFGRPYILKTNGCIHDGWLVLRDYQKYLNIDFFYYVLSSENVQKQFRIKAQGSTVSNLNTDRVASVIIYVPTFERQQSIVDTLDSLKSKVDKLQENYNKISQECDALKQAILRKVFE